MVHSSLKFLLRQSLVPLPILVLTGYHKKKKKNNITTIGFRFYEPFSVQYASTPPTLSEIENSARNDGLLVSADHIRRGLWNFVLPTRQGGLPVAQTPDRLVEIYGQPFVLREESSFEPSNLLKNRMHCPNSANTPSSSSSGGSALEPTLRSAQSFGLSPQGITQSSSPSHLDFSNLQFQGIDSRIYGSTHVNDVHEHFVTALLSSLTSAFARRTGAIPLNSRSLALPLSIFSPDPPLPAQHEPALSNTVATLRAYITTTGSLVVSIQVTVFDGLMPLQGSIDASTSLQRTPILLAPLGLFGNVSGFRDAESPFNGSAVQSPETQVVRFRNQPEDRIKQWHHVWTKVLESRGISPSVLDHTSWVTITVLRTRPIDPKGEGRLSPLPQALIGIAWPAVLCFCKKSWDPIMGMVNRLDENTLGGRAETYDPVSSAKTWFSGSAEREALISKRKQEREVPAKPPDAPDVTQKQQHPGTGNSPLILRRTTTTTTRPDAAAVSAMYPTPPDAVQNLANGMTPSFDGVVSSPVNGTHSTALIDLDATIGGPISAKDDIRDLFDVQDKPKSAASLFGAEPENLFGDIGDDMYGGASVTDADFDYFDKDTSELLADLEARMDVGGGEDAMRNSATDTLKPPVPADKAPIEANQAVFAKPELKHARSSKADADHLRQQQNITGNRIVPVKRQASPFDANTVYKRVKSSLGMVYPVSLSTSRNGSGKSILLEKINLDSFLSQVGKKYVDHGRFGCPQKASEESGGYMERSAMESVKLHWNEREKPKDQAFNPRILAKVMGLVNGKTGTATRKQADNTLGGDDSSVKSDPDYSSSESEAPPSPVKSVAPTSRPLEDDGISVATSFRDLETAEDGPAISSTELSRYARGAGSPVSLLGYFSDHEPFAVNISLSDEDFITIAQILTDQAATGNLKYPPRSESVRRPLGGKRRGLLAATRISVGALYKDVDKLLGDPVHCQLRSFIEVPDVPLIGQPTRMQGRQNAEDRAKNSHLFPIGPPHLEFKRAGSRMSLLPPAVPFWESLGLGPSLGIKDVSGVCVYPDWEGMTDNANLFLERLRSAYESLKLGHFHRIPLSKDGQLDGVLPFEVEKISTSNDYRVNSSQADKMDKLAHAMADSDLKARNFVVFFMYTPDNHRSLVEACISFQLLFQIYRRQLAEKRATPENELVLQLVPLDFVASPSAVVIAPPSEVSKLALETYDRCTLFRGPMPAPSIILEKPFAKSIDFKLTTAPPVSLLKENSCIHVAYAQSIDERWISAAWTDTRGSQQVTASYCLGRKGTLLSTSITDVVREIWETTHEIISDFRVHWRVIVTKCGPMSPQELTFWQEVGSQKTNQAPTMSPTLLTVDTNPSLQLMPPISKVPSTAPSAFYTTPVSTPQASGSIRSPDQNKDATTPSDNAMSELGPHSSLVDVSERSWGAILAHRLNTSASLTQLSPSLISGYLIKSGGSMVEDAPVVMEVNIVHSEVNARLYENLLKELLCQFRALGSLSRARGTTGLSDVRPWHVAAAEKGVRACYLLI